LLGVRFESIGHPDARLGGLKLRFTGVEEEPCDALLFLRNGGGKSSILNLFFSVVRPGQREFLGKDKHNASRKLGDYVLAEDVASVSLEWLLDATGTELRFKNSDPFDHRLYGVGFEGLPASTIAKGADRRWSVKDRGSFEIRDELSPSVRSWIVSQPGTVATAFPAADGTFSISIDEPGLYTLQAYFSGKPVGSPLPVSVARRNLDLRARPLVLATQPPKEGKSPR
jgi:hypothetical protein